MKKIIVLLLVCTAVMLAGCNGKNAGTAERKEAINATTQSSQATKNGNVIELKEKMFVAQSNDIYLNSEDYLGKTIKYEGIFRPEKDPDNKKTYYAVIRYGPGCCGTDSNCGFEVAWNKEYPKADAWVAVEGRLEQYKDGNNQYLRIALTSLEVKKQRGAETVLQ